MQTLLRRIHPVTGGMAIACIAGFMAASVIAELYGDAATVIATKNAIVRGLLVLIPCLMATGLSGYMATGRAPTGLASVKLRRMRVIGANGLCILVPCAFFLAYRASETMFDWRFYSVQALELLAGSVNLTLMTMNFRDGIRLARMRRPGKCTMAAR